MSFTRDTISFDEIRAYRDGCEEAGDEEGVWYGNRALDQFVDYRLYGTDGADVDALDEVCARLNQADTVIAAAFEAVRPVIAQLEVDVLAARNADTFSERKNWRGWLTQYTALAKGWI